MERSTLDPTRIDALVFDVIGSLVDEDATWAEAAEHLAADVGAQDVAALRASWSDGLDHRMRAVVRGEAPWSPRRRLLVDAAREAVGRTGVEATPRALARAASLDDRHRAWPDVAPALAALRRRRTVVALSNADADSLARIAAAEAISWDAALSTGTVRTFKPAPEAYRHAIDALGLEPARTLFVAAHPWDLRAAAEHGFRTAYLARPGAERPSADDRFDLVTDDAAGVAARLSGGGAPRPDARTSAPAADG